MNFFLLFIFIVLSPSFLLLGILALRWLAFLSVGFIYFIFSFLFLYEIFIRCCIERTVEKIGRHMGGLK